MKLNKLDIHEETNWTSMKHENKLNKSEQTGKLTNWTSIGEQTGHP
jgi:hypothetical protein